jgi:hypothetical protein
MPRSDDLEIEPVVATEHGIARRTNRCNAVLLLLSAVAYLYLNLFSPPATPLLLGGDQTYFWMDGQRMLSGEQPYRDFFQFTPPGTDLFYFLLFKLFGPHIWVTNFAVLVLGVALTWICFDIASGIMERELALLAASLFLVFIYGRALNATHHWFSILAVMCAVRVWQRPTTARLMTAGALLGLASFFTQTRGGAALVAFSIFLVWQRQQSGNPWRDLARQLVLLLTSFAVTLLALSARFIAIAGARLLWYDEVTYVRLFMVHGLVSQFMGLPEPFSWAALPRLAPYLFVYASLPAIYSLMLWKCWRERRNPPCAWSLVTLLTMVGLFLLVEVASSLNWLRLYAVAMPGMILLVWALGRAKTIRPYAIAITWIIISAVAIRQIGVRYLGDRLVLETPGGKTLVSPQTSTKLQSLMKYTKPGQSMFQAAGPGIYLPLQLRNSVFLDAVETNQQTRPEHVERTIQELEVKEVQFVLWSPRLDDTNLFDRRTEKVISPLRNYVRKRYVRVQVFPDRDELWERK